MGCTHGNTGWRPQSRTPKLQNWFLPWDKRQILICVDISDKAACPHLVEVWPVGADGQLHLPPGARRRTGHVPNGHARGTVVLFDVDVQVTRVAVVPTSDVVVENYTVGVVLLQLGGQQQSLLPCEASRRVHHHESRTCSTEDVDRRNRRNCYFSVQVLPKVVV